MEMHGTPIKLHQGPLRHKTAFGLTFCEVLGGEFIQYSAVVTPHNTVRVNFNDLGFAHRQALKAAFDRLSLWGAPDQEQIIRSGNLPRYNTSWEFDIKLKDWLLDEISIGAYLVRSLT